MLPQHRPRMAHRKKNQNLVKNKNLVPQPQPLGTRIHSRTHCESVRLFEQDTVHQEALARPGTKFS
jgi:hypothetical protein